MASTHLMVGAVLFANENAHLLSPTARSSWSRPGCICPSCRLDPPVVVEYDVIEGHNVLTNVPAIRA